MKIMKGISFALLVMASFAGFAASKVITFTPAPVTADAAPFTCDATQSGYSFTASLLTAPSGCVIGNLYPTFGSLTAGKVGTSAYYGMIAPAGVTFSLKAFNLKYVTQAKGYPAIAINTIDVLGNANTVTLPLKSAGVYDVSGLALDNLAEAYISSRTASRLELTNISIIDSQ